LSRSMEIRLRVRYRYYVLTGDAKVRLRSPLMQYAAASAIRNQQRKGLELSPSSHEEVDD